MKKNSNPGLCNILDKPCPNEYLCINLKFTNMGSISMKKTRVILDLETKKTKSTFLLIHLLLLLGVILIVSTLLYLLFNLDQSDRVINKCAFIIISGLVLVVFYIIGYNGIKKKQNIDRQYFK
jgi:SNF family Na+-dependent transporter